jgi:hypothetical protein
MTPQEIISQAHDRASEWVEMSDNPAAVVAGVLARHIVELNNYIDYLERRLENVSISKRII